MLKCSFSHGGAYLSLNCCDLSFILIKGYHSASGIRQRGVEYRTTVNQVIHYLTLFINGEYLQYVL
ncbi:hypothetical protein F7725_008228 [Dissostichus mawsoni]|uniref:Uncharacterized protein n=1 Tax=Dissostichus mawsoni TaxID=36200 RepID=A0A7J5Y6K1_DISMA|nr:hypothetical protein F7725_008228 [Dissostichus mawsoni]